MENALFIVTAIVNPANAQELPGYQAQAMESIKAHGGSPVSRFKTVESLSGDDSPEMVAVMTFPSAQDIKDMINSEAFQALNDLRAKVFSKLNMMISESL